MEKKNYPFKTEEVGGTITTPDFWDCECDVNYIHSKRIPNCPLCGAKRENSPDSHADEVLKQIYRKM